jgi:hypothetical protein
VQQAEGWTEGAQVPANPASLTFAEVSQELFSTLEDNLLKALTQACWVLACM